jgi:hypothetical protein
MAAAAARVHKELFQFRQLKTCPSARLHEMARGPPAAGCSRWA